MKSDFNFTRSPPLSLYVHLPWCVRKCPYCDFNSHEKNNSSIDESGYIDALAEDLGASYSLIEGRDIHSIFIGGGTPSLFTARSIDRLLCVIDEKIGLTDNIEITLEANPGSADADRFADYRIAGITRLSIGVQSFNQAQLQAIGRIHNDKQAIDAVKFARLAGFEQINLDLMYGLPDQTRHQAMVDLGTAINQGTPHLSWYQLTIEPNTVYYKRPPKLPSEEKIWDIQESGHEALAQAGYDHYEISAYARDSMYCRHNMNYWHFGDYLGIGAGAHSKITNTGNNSITRYSRYKNPDRYMQLTGSDGAATSHWELSDEDVILEFMMNALRLTGGFEIQAFEDMTGLPYSSLSGQLEIARKKSLLEISSNKIIPTRKGHNYLNDLLHCFMPS